MHFTKPIGRIGVRWLIPALLAGACLAALAPTAEARIPRVVRIATHGHSTLPTPIDKSCPSIPDAVQTYALRGGTVHGDQPEDTYVGTDTWVGCFYVFPDQRLISIGTARFRGRMGACGTGEISYSYYAELSPPDPVTGARHDDTTTVIHPYSGSGELASVAAGHIDIDGHVTPELTETTVGTGTLLC